MLPFPRISCKMFLLPEIRSYIVFVFVFMAESFPVVVASDPLANKFPHFVVNKVNIIFSFLTSVAAAALGTSWMSNHLSLLDVKLLGAISNK